MKFFLLTVIIASLICSEGHASRKDSLQLSVSSSMAWELAERAQNLSVDFRATKKWYGITGYYLIRTAAFSVSHYDRSYPDYPYFAQSQLLGVNLNLIPISTKRFDLLFNLGFFYSFTKDMRGAGAFAYFEYLSPNANPPWMAYFQMHRTNAFGGMYGLEASYRLTKRFSTYIKGSIAEQEFPAVDFFSFGVGVRLSI